MEDEQTVLSGTLLTMGNVEAFMQSLRELLGGGFTVADGRGWWPQAKVVKLELRELAGGGQTLNFDISDSGGFSWVVQPASKGLKSPLELRPGSALTCYRFTDGRLRVTVVNYDTYGGHQDELVIRGTVFVPHRARPTCSP